MKDFDKKVLDVLKLIPYGKVTTYGNIARKIGCPRGARAVGNAAHRNPQPVVIPCNRVVNSQGKLAKNFGFGGIEKQAELLMEEGVKITNYKVENMEQYLVFKQ